jgi:hypothetical protein
VDWEVVRGQQVQPEQVIKRAGQLQRLPNAIASGRLCRQQVLEPVLDGNAPCHSATYVGGRRRPVSEPLELLQAGEHRLVCGQPVRRRLSGQEVRLRRSHSPVQQAITALSAGRGLMQTGSVESMWRSEEQPGRCRRPEQPRSARTCYNNVRRRAGARDAALYFSAAARRLRCVNGQGDACAHLWSSSGTATPAFACAVRTRLSSPIPSTGVWACRCRGYRRTS